MVERIIKLQAIGCRRSDCHLETLQKAEDYLWESLEAHLGADFNRVKHLYKVHHSPHHLASALVADCGAAVVTD